MITKNLILLHSKAKLIYIFRKDTFTKGTKNDFIAFLKDKGVKINRKTRFSNHFHFECNTQKRRCNRIGVFSFRQHVLLQDRYHQQAVVPLTAVGAGAQGDHPVGGGGGGLCPGAQPVAPVGTCPQTVRWDGEGSSRSIQRGFCVLTTPRLTKAAPVKIGAA